MVRTRSFSVKSKKVAEAVREQCHERLERELQQWQSEQQQQDEREQGSPCLRISSRGPPL